MINKINILHIVRDPKGGAGVVVEHIVEGLCSDQFKPFVLFDSDKNSPMREKLTNSSGINTINLSKIKNDESVLTKHRKKGRDIGTSIKRHLGTKAFAIYSFVRKVFKFIVYQLPSVATYIRILRKNKIDCVHTHSSLDKSIPEIVASRILNIPILCHNHKTVDVSSFEKLFAPLVTKFLHISNYVFQHYTEMGIPQNKSVVIHNGVCLEAFNRNFDTDKIRKDFNINSNSALVGIIGRIDWWKGHEFFIKAIARALNQQIDIVGIIIGDVAYHDPKSSRSYLQYLKSLAEELGISDRIIFTGFQEEIPRLVSSLDILVHASTEPEPFGLVIIEGMAANKPVIATAAGGVLDIIEDGENGFLVPLKDSILTSEIIKRLIQNQDLSKSISIAAKKRVTEYFSIEYQLEKLQNLYCSIHVIRS